LTSSDHWFNLETVSKSTLAHANTFNPIVVPKATSLPEVIVKPDGQNNKMWVIAMLGIPNHLLMMARLTPFFLSWHLLGPYTFQTGLEVRTS
jgi:hypothetical protein